MTATPCPGCARPVAHTGHPAPGELAHRARGYCRTCWDKARRTTPRTPRAHDYPPPMPVDADPSCARLGYAWAAVERDIERHKSSRAARLYDLAATAVAVCGNCPARALCVPIPGYTGVIAGAVYVDGLRVAPPDPVAVAREAMSDEECLAAHRAYTRGERTPSVVLGQREYDRRRRETAA